MGLKKQMKANGILKPNLSYMVWSSLLQVPSFMDLIISWWSTSEDTNWARVKVDSKMSVWTYRSICGIDRASKTARDREVGFSKIGDVRKRDTNLKD